MAKNKYPQGKLCDEDEGELEIRIAHEKGQVRIEFGAPTAWFAMPPNMAREFAHAILIYAREADKMEAPELPKVH